MGTLSPVAKELEQLDAVKAGRARRVQVWLCHCIRCGHKWTSESEEIPSGCANCRAINWWIKRPVGRPPAPKADGTKKQS